MVDAVTRKPIWKHAIIDQDGFAFVGAPVEPKQVNLWLFNVNCLVVYNFQTAGVNQQVDANSTGGACSRWCSNSYSTVRFSRSPRRVNISSYFTDDLYLNYAIILSFIRYKGPIPSYVEKVMFSSNSEESHIIKIQLRQTRRPEIGDKFSSRHGQKGVTGRPKFFRISILQLTDFFFLSFNR